MILLQDLQGITRLDLSKDMSVHVSAVWKMWRWKDVYVSTYRLKNDWSVFRASN
jgi:hypothetical protein